MAIVDAVLRSICIGGFWFDRSFFTAFPPVVTLTAPQTAGVFPSAFTTAVRPYVGGSTPDSNRCSQ